MTLVKICGVTREEDALAAARAGADLVGFVFAPSPRRVRPDVAARIAAKLPSRVKRVGVFTGVPSREMRRIAALVGLDMIQLYGGKVGGEVHPRGLPYLHALRCVRERDLAAAQELVSRRSQPTPYVLDGPRGGSIDLDLAARAPGRFFLAGGLDTQNVTTALARVRPYGVDVSRGVERSPGRKDPSAIQAFLEAVRRFDKAKTPRRRHGSLAARPRSRRADPPAGPANDRSASPLEGPPARCQPRRGFFGPFGGRFVPETVVPALDELDRAFRAARRDQTFCEDLHTLLRDFIGRPTPLHEARRLGARWKGARVFLKREDLAHTGAHKINSCVGQGLLARRLGKSRVIAETGAGQHGVATATAAALLGLRCRVYMGRVDMGRQASNVSRMRLLGAEVVAVDEGTATLRDATSEAIRDWVTHVRGTHYVLGSAVGPAPYPEIVRTFQSVIGREARRQILRQAGRLPDAVVACVGGGSNAIGIFHGFLRDPGVALYGVEAGGRGRAVGQHAASLTRGRPGVLHGSYSYLLQDPDGQVLDTHSISAGLDYPGVGPEHAQLHARGRATYTAVSDAAALRAFHELTRTEGILPALEPAHALAFARTLSRQIGPKGVLLVNLSGRGDKDAGTIVQ